MKWQIYSFLQQHNFLLLKFLSGACFTCNSPKVGLSKVNTHTISPGTLMIDVAKKLSHH